LLQKKKTKQNLSKNSFFPKKRVNESVGWVCQKKFLTNESENLTKSVKLDTEAQLLLMRNFRVFSQRQIFLFCNLEYFWEKFLNGIFSKFLIKWETFSKWSEKKSNDFISHLLLYQSRIDKMKSAVGKIKKHQTWQNYSLRIFRWLRWRGIPLKSHILDAQYYSSRGNRLVGC